MNNFIRLWANSHPDVGQLSELLVFYECAWYICMSILALVKIYSLHPDVGVLWIYMVTVHTHVNPHFCENLQLIIWRCFLSLSTYWCISSVYQLWFIYLYILAIFWVVVCSQVRIDSVKGDFPRYSGQVRLKELYWLTPSLIQFLTIPFDFSQAVTGISWTYDCLCVP